MAKMIPKNSTMVSVRHTPRFSLSRHGLFHLASALSHSRSSAFSSRFSTKAMQMPMSSGDSSPAQGLQQPAQQRQVVQAPVQQRRKGDKQHNALAGLVVQFQSVSALSAVYLNYFTI